MIELYTAPTPNGWKISVLLEELGWDYQVHRVNLAKGEQKSDEFLSLNPNGKIPVIRDTQENITIFESAAIMQYLAEKSGQFMGKNIEQKYQVLQWLMFNIGGIGPMMGQANVFNRYFPEKIQSVIDRYQNEVKRLFSVMDKHLQNRDFLAEEYSIADIANWCWVHISWWAGVELEPFDNLRNWVENIADRPAVIKGINIPPKPKPEDIKKAGQKII